MTDDLFRINVKLKQTLEYNTVEVSDGMCYIKTVLTTPGGSITHV